jgi:hypothetical protein
MFPAKVRNKDKKPGKAAVNYTLTGIAAALTGKSRSLRSKLRGEACGFAPVPIILCRKNGRVGT